MKQTREDEMREAGYTRKLTPVVVPLTRPVRVSDTTVTGECGRNGTRLALGEQQLKKYP